MNVFIHQTRSCEAILDVAHREFSCNERSEQRAGSGSVVRRTLGTELDRVRRQPILQAYKSFVKIFTYFRFFPFITLGGAVWE